MNKKHLIGHRWIIGFITFTLIALSGYSGSQAQTHDPALQFSSEKLKEDFSIFRTALEEAHGALYRFTPKETMDGHFNSAVGRLTGPMTEPEFYKLLLPIIADVNCGHTNMMFSANFLNNFRRQPINFPFGLRFIGDKIYIFYNFSKNLEIERGSELLAVNGRSGAEIVKTMLPFISSDAHIQTAKYRRMEDPAFFGMLFSVVYGPESSFSVRYLPPGKKGTKEFTCKGILSQDIRRIADERYPQKNKNAPQRSLEYRNGIPILTIRTFGGAVNRGDVSFREFLKNSFTEIVEKDAKSLIIDLRGNTGGNDDFGRFLSAHLIDEPFRYYESLEIKNIEPSIREHTNLTPPRVEYLKKNTLKNDHGTYDVLGHPNLGIMQPFEPTFRGKVFILINGRSFSATGESTSLIHFYKKAEFIGEECGAGYYGNTSGASIQLTLPHSKIRVNIPQMRYSMAVSGYPHDRGIIPEHPVTPTIEDLLSGKDVVMEHALNLAGGTEKSAGDPTILEKYQFVARGKMSRERGVRPADIARKDNNGEILIACREAKSTEQLKSSGLNFLASQLELLVDWDLLEYDRKAKTY